MGRRTSFRNVFPALHEPNQTHQSRKCLDCPSVAAVRRSSPPPKSTFLLWQFFKAPVRLFNELHEDRVADFHEATAVAIGVAFGTEFHIVAWRRRSRRRFQNQVRRFLRLAFWLVRRRDSTNSSSRHTRTNDHRRRRFFFQISTDSVSCFIPLSSSPEKVVIYSFLGSSPRPFSLSVRNS